MMATLKYEPKKAGIRLGLPEIGFCEEKYRRLDLFLDASRRMIAVQNLQMRAVIEGDTDFARFDELLHAAQEEREAAKYAWMAHVEEHGCEKG
jgi:hypothetical protein